MTGIITTLCFFAGILGIYYCIPVHTRWMLLLAASGIFYASADWRMLFLFAGSIVISWIAGNQIERAEDTRVKKKWLVGSITVLTLILFYFKYVNFFTESVAHLLSAAGMGSESLVLKLTVPMGISYYTFKIISYLADVYKGKLKAEVHLGFYALYISFFPQILCGPIERAEYFLPQIKCGCRYEEGLAVEGIERIILGLFKKLVIADRLSLYVGTVFDAPLAYPGLASLMAAFFYSIQIYCDFSGYSDLSIGMAKMFGIRTRENFAYPYFSRSIKEFWTRWHISLSGWLRDYIYIPLGGNRKGILRKHVNTMITFLISGLWHGSSITFVFWGGLHGLWNMISTPKKKEESTWKQLLQTLLTFCGVTFTWIFFRASDLKTALVMLRHMVMDFGISVGQITSALLPFTGDNTCAAHFLLICLLILFLGVFEWRKTGGRANGRGWLAVMLFVTLLLGKFGNSSFLYGNF